MDDVIKSARISVERKQFFFELRRNVRGMFLRVTEDVNGRRDTIIVPASGLNEFLDAIKEMTEASSNAPSPSSIS